LLTCTLNIASASYKTNKITHIKCTIKIHKKENEINKTRTKNVGTVGKQQYTQNTGMKTLNPDKH